MSRTLTAVTVGGAATLVAVALVVDQMNGLPANGSGAVPGVVSSENVLIRPTSVPKAPTGTDQERVHRIVLFADYQIPKGRIELKHVMVVGSHISSLNPTSLDNNVLMRESESLDVRKWSSNSFSAHEGDVVKVGIDTGVKAYPASCQVWQDGKRVVPDPSKPVKRGPHMISCWWLVQPI